MQGIDFCHEKEFRGHARNIIMHLEHRQIHKIVNNKDTRWLLQPNAFVVRS